MIWNSYDISSRVIRNQMNPTHAITCIHMYSRLFFTLFNYGVTICMYSMLRCIEIHRVKDSTQGKCILGCRTCKYLAGPVKLKKSLACQTCYYFFTNFKHISTKNNNIPGNINWECKHSFYKCDMREKLSLCVKLGCRQTYLKIIAFYFDGQKHNFNFSFYNKNPCAWLPWHWSSRGQLALCNPRGR